MDTDPEYPESYRAVPVADATQRSSAMDAGLAIFILAVVLVATVIALWMVAIHFEDHRSRHEIQINTLFSEVEDLKTKRKASHEINLGFEDEQGNYWEGK